MRKTEAMNCVFGVLPRRAFEVWGDVCQDEAPVSFTWSPQAR
jgi:hypothetical protein